jgi:hypothetical protein
MRTDDGGLTWTTISSPTSPAIVEVDLNNHDHLVAASEHSTFSSIDGGATWNRTADLPDRAVTLILSAADPGLTYVATGPRWPTEGFFRLLRSRDGMQSWEVIREERQPTNCGWSVFLLTTHAADSQRVFRSAECVFGGVTFSDLEESADQGDTWSKLFEQRSEYPRELLTGSTPIMWLLTDKDARSPGFGLYRLDDRDSTWQEVGLLPSRSFEAGHPYIELRGLTQYPSNPQRACVAATTFERQSGQPKGGASSAFCTSDGGASWRDLGTGPGSIESLVIGIDGANLYAATEQGVWVRPLTDIYP